MMMMMMMMTVAFIVDGSLLGPDFSLPMPFSFCSQLKHLGRLATQRHSTGRFSIYPPVNISRHFASQFSQVVQEVERNRKEKTKKKRIRISPIVADLQYDISYLSVRPPPLHPNYKSLSLSAS